MIELVVVVVIIGITAAMATPSVIELMRERRGRQASQGVASIYSTARMRAMARGAATMVQYRAATGEFTVLESIEGAAAIARGQDACATQPGLGCLSTQWGVAANSRVIDRYTMDASGTNFEFQMYDTTNTARAMLDVCFTPLGRSFLSTNGTAPTAPMVGTPRFTITKGVKSGKKYWTRNVVILPNGVARIGI